MNKAILFWRRKIDEDNLLAFGEVSQSDSKRLHLGSVVHEY